MPGGQWSQPAPVAGAPAPEPGPVFDPKTRTLDLSGSSGSKTARRVGCGLVPLIVFLVVAGVVVSALRSCDDALSSTRSQFQNGFGSNASVLTLSGSVTVLPSSGSGSSTDVIAITQDTQGSDTVRRVARIGFTSDGSTLRWQSDPVDDSASRAEVAVVGDTLFAAIDDDLLALDATTGATRWTGTLHDKVTTGCPSCFASVGGKLVVRTTDAYVTGYGTKSAEPLWSNRLNSTSGSTSVAGDRLFIVDDPEDATKVTTASLIDPSSGKAIRTVAPTCPDDADTPWNLEMSAGDQVLAVPGGKDVLAAFGFGDGCIVRWEPVSGKVRWTSRLTGMSSVSDGTFLGSQDLVVGNTSGQLVTIYLPNGKAKQLPVPKDLGVAGNQVVGRTFIADTQTTRGTPRHGLMAWDLSTGEKTWAQSDLGAAQPVSTGSYHPSDALFDGSPRSLLVPVDDGIQVFVFEGTDHTFSVSPLDLSTGDLGTEIRRAYLTRYQDPGTVSLSIEGQSGDHLLVSIDTLLQSLPVSGKGDVVSYPEQN